MEWHALVKFTIVGKISVKLTEIFSGASGTSGRVEIGSDLLDQTTPSDQQRLGRAENSNQRMVNSSSTWYQGILGSINSS